MKKLGRMAIRGHIVVRPAIYLCFFWLVFLYHYIGANFIYPIKTIIYP
jgi:hypothetical protein